MAILKNNLFSFFLILKIVPAGMNFQECLQKLKNVLKTEKCKKLKLSKKRSEKNKKNKSIACALTSSSSLSSSLSSSISSSSSDD
jgi:hypothetical protein